MGIEQNGRLRRVVGGKAFDEDVKEEKVGFGGGEKETAGVVDGLEVGELVSEFGEGGKVVVLAVEDDLGVGLREVGESGGLVEEVQEEGPAAWCTTSRRYVSANHYLSLIVLEESGLHTSAVKNIHSPDSNFKRRQRRRTKLSNQSNEISLQWPTKSGTFQH